MISTKFTKLHLLFHLLLFDILFVASLTGTMAYNRHLKNCISFIFRKLIDCRNIVRHNGGRLELRSLYLILKADNIRRYIHILFFHFSKLRKLFIVRHLKQLLCTQQLIYHQKLFNLTKGVGDCCGQHHFHLVSSFE